MSMAKTKKKALIFQHSLLLGFVSAFTVGYGQISVRKILAKMLF
jgi:hypothetical protein